MGKRVESLFFLPPSTDYIRLKAYSWEIERYLYKHTMAQHFKIHSLPPTSIWWMQFNFHGFNGPKQYQTFAEIDQNIWAPFVLNVTCYSETDFSVSIIYLKKYINVLIKIYKSLNKKKNPTVFQGVFNSMFPLSVKTASFKQGWNETVNWIFSVFVGVCMCAHVSWVCMCAHVSWECVCAHTCHESVCVCTCVLANHPQMLSLLH